MSVHEKDYSVGQLILCAIEKMISLDQAEKLEDIVE